MQLRWLINLFLPGSPLFLLAGLCFGVLLLFGSERLRRFGRLWLLLLALFYVVGSTRAGADLMLSPLYQHTAFVQDAAAAKGATAVVQLNAGAGTYRARGQDYFGINKDGALRALETARVYRLLGNPLVIVQGGFPEPKGGPTLGAIFSKVLVELGIPANRIVLEPNSRDTREHVENLRPYLEKHRIERFVLVTSPVHMRRAVAAFRRQGYDFVPSAAAVESELDAYGSSLPFSQDNLDRIVWGTHEYLGLAYYWWQDWL
jgi:uncharacterized SAM-binding protein YcdF (DUF218 family)